jgi:hypothetical protein
MTTFIIITGNPVDGFNYWGPYPTHTEAAEEASEFFRTCDWWISDISDPKEVI